MKFFRVKLSAILTFGRNCLQEEFPSQWSKMNRDIETEFVHSQTFSQNLLSKIFQQSKQPKATREIRCCFTQILFYRSF